MIFYIITYFYRFLTGLPCHRLARNFDGERSVRRFHGREDLFGALTLPERR